MRNSGCELACCLPFARGSYTPRDEAPGVHHVTLRGNNKQAIFRTERDHDRLSRATQRGITQARLDDLRLLPDAEPLPLAHRDRGARDVTWVSASSTPRMRRRSTTGTAASTICSAAATGADGSKTTRACSAFAATYFSTRSVVASSAIQQPGAGAATARPRDWRTRNCRWRAITTARVLRRRPALEAATLFRRFVRDAR